MVSFRTAPNLLTVSRVLLAILYGACLAFPSTSSLGAALILTILAFVTDLLDGYWARKMNLVSAFGICFDPVADKIFNLCAFAMLAPHPSLALPMFAFSLIIIREVGISGIRVVLMSANRILLPAERFGKTKSGLQFALILIFTFGLWMESAGWGRPVWLERPYPARAFWLVALFTFASSWVHLWRHRKALTAAWEGNKA